MLGSEDPTLKAIEWLTPFGKGSRVTIVGGAARRARREALRRLATALAGRDDLTRPGRAGRASGPRRSPSGATAPRRARPRRSASPPRDDAAERRVEPVIDQARRLAARGADAVVLIDTLDGCSPQPARKAAGVARATSSTAAR